MHAHLRLARPVTLLSRAVSMYCEGLGLRVLGSFEDHDGFDGVMLGHEGADYHFEFTVCHQHPVEPAQTAEDLVVFYIPDKNEWTKRVESMHAAGFVEVNSFNPYWDKLGKTFADPDGYLVVLQNAAWANAAQGVKP